MNNNEQKDLEVTKTTTYKLSNEKIKNGDTYFNPACYEAFKKGEGVFGNIIEKCTTDGEANSCNNIVPYCIKVEGVMHEWQQSRIEGKSQANVLLAHLYALKQYKDRVGKDEHYLTEQPKLWKAVEDYLANIDQQPKVEGKTADWDIKTALDKAIGLLENMRSHIDYLPDNYNYWINEVHLMKNKLKKIIDNLTSPTNYIR